MDYVVGKVAVIADHTFSFAPSINQFYFICALSHSSLIFSGDECVTCQITHIYLGIFFVLCTTDFWTKLASAPMCTDFTCKYCRFIRVMAWHYTRCGVQLCCVLSMSLLQMANR